MSKLAPPIECPNCKQPVYWDEVINTDRLHEGIIEISWQCDYLASGCCATHGQDYACNYVYGPFAFNLEPFGD